VVSSLPTEREPLRLCGTETTAAALRRSDERGVFDLRFVSGHEFTRAVIVQSNLGFSPWPAALSIQ
jgi:hypothetical protein